MDLSKFASNLKILSGTTLLKVILDLISYLAFSQKYTKYTCTLKSGVLKKQYIKNHVYIRLGFGV